MLFNYRLSKFIRAFSSLVCLAPILFEGNLHYFFFVLFEQISHGFSLNPRDKFLNAFSFIIFFFIIWLSVVSCFVAYYLNKKLTKYIVGNWRTCVEGLLAYTLTNTVRLLLMGAIHSLLRGKAYQLPILFAIEGLYFLFMMLSLKRLMIHRLKAKLWFVMIFSLLRIVLQIILYVQDRLCLIGSDS